MDVESDLPPPDTRASPTSAAIDADEEAVAASILSAAVETPLRGRAAAPTSAVVLHLRDGEINCVCPPGTLRLAKDLIMSVTQERGLSWFHAPCKPYSAKATITFRPLTGLSPSATLGSADAVRAAPEMFLQGFLGENPSPQTLQKAKNFTSKFICDGPCNSAKLADYIVCKKCLAWQHKECMLYGEPGDDGGPVCNECYQWFMAHYEEIDKWQRKRLLQAVNAATEYLLDPDTSHQVWRRTFCQKFLTRFFSANKGRFIEFVAKRRMAEQATQRARAFVPAHALDPNRQAVAQLAAADAAAIDQALNEPDPQRKSLRKRTSTVQQTYSDNLNGAADDAIKTEAITSAGSSDNIIVAPSSSKAKNTTPKPQKKKKAATEPAKAKRKRNSSPAKRSHKRKRALSLEFSPEPYSETRDKPRHLLPKPGYTAVRKTAPPQGNSRPTYLPGSSELDSDSEEEYGNMSTEMADAKPMSLSSGDNIQVANRNDPEDNPFNVNCVCENFSSPHDTAFKCHGCGRLQHLTCGIPYQEEGREMCNDCFTLEPMELAEATSSAAAAKSKSQGPIIDLTEDDTEPTSKPVSTKSKPRASTTTAGTKPKPRASTFNLAESISKIVAPKSKPRASIIPAGTKPKSRTSTVPAGTKPKSRLASSAATNQSMLPPSTSSASGAGTKLNSRPASSAATNQSMLPPSTSSASGDWMDEAMLDEIHQLSSTVMWREYKALEAMREPPTAPRPPQGWLAECETRLTGMLKIVGEKQTEKYLTPVLQRYPRDPAAIVQTLRQLGSWLVKHGPLVNKKGELGLVAEILRLDYKGTHWRGDGW